MNIKILILPFLLFISSRYQLCYTQLIKADSFEETSISAFKNSNNLNRDILFQSLPPNFDYNEVRCILKDYKGYMWFGTADGLVRYDGIDLYLYEDDPDDSASLSHSSVYALVEDENKNLWIGTSIGLNLYNRDKDNFIQVGDINPDVYRLNNNYINALCSDKNSFLWVGTFGDGLNVYDPKEQRLYHYSYNVDDPISISSNRITSIEIDGDNNLWLGTHNGLNLFLGETEGFRHFYSEPENPESLSDSYISDLAVDQQGNLWIGTKEGGVNKLIKREGKYVFKRYISKSGKGSLSSNNILSINADNEGNLWIGTENGGLNCLNIDAEYFNVYKVEEGNPFSINSNSIWALFSDDENRIWIGTYNKGINVIDEKFSKFESFQKNIVNKNSLPDNDVTGFAEDKNGNIWIATDGGGICRFVIETHQFDKITNNSTENNSLINNAIIAILYDSKDNIWLGTWDGGIEKLNSSGNKISNYRVEAKKGSGNNRIFTLYEDSKGNIWAGTAGSGLFRYNAPNDQFIQITSANQSGVLTTSAYISSILEDSDGSLWIATLYGLAKLDENNYCISFIKDNDSSSISSNSIYYSYKDSQNRLWFGTYDKGLNLYNKQNNTFIYFQEKHGLPSNTIRGIIEDDEGYLWITTNKGISRFNYDSLSFTNYTIEDGLNSNEFYTRAIYKTRRGELFVGGENGFNTFFPQNIRKNNIIPPVYLTSLKINNVQAEIGAEGSPLTNNIGETKEIILNHKQSSFTIEFAALNYTRPARNQFKYKLDGFDNDWNYINNKRSASYTNIRPGRYVFMVKGSNNDGIWNDSPAELKIRIKPPYWQRWWAIIIYIVVFTVITIVSLRIWNERIKIKHQLKVEQLAREKEHELNESNIQFFTNISHEFRTPLSLIIGPLESIVLTAPLKIKEQLVVIYRNAQRLLHLTNNLMDFRKLEEGRVTLKVRNGDIVNFISGVSSYFNVRAKRRHIKFSFEAKVIDTNGWFDPDKIETILLNLLSNAFKNTSDNGEIKIILNIMQTNDLEKEFNCSVDDSSKDNQYLEIQVIDNGVGIDPLELPLIFEKYYQSKATKNNKAQGRGTGIGLSLTKGLVELHYGFIKVKSVLNSGTCFSVAIPVSRSAYKDTEIVSEPADILERAVLNEAYDSIKQEIKEGLANQDQDEEKYNILIVEDNLELRTFLAKELSEGFNVSKAEDGKIGVDLAFQHIPDLIVSDILMPNYSGIDLCKIIKSDIRTSHIPIILLTAKTTINDQIEGVEIGADAYITKPFNMKLLYIQINQLIQTRRKLYAQFSQEVYIMPNKMTDNELDQNFLQKAIDYIIMNITDNNLSVEELSNALNLSRSNVYRKIKALTGNTIIEFIRIVRLKHAIKLMETKKYSLAEIAYMTGFTSPSYFTKSFKDQYGKPPSEYI
ncbi:MAG: response regulator [Bacteroidales bacterium]|nr:response regulator [Bacteroidales bacterium]